ncbi:MAG: hypothetical protein J0I23_28140 [Rhizobiales bacterium]|nr:hypothetical protein [Hyphomicrobiales bacterium]
MHDQDLSDVWTPKLVRERLIAAVRWARYHAGPTGPAQVRALYPTYVPSLDDFAEEGWGFRENADDSELEPPPPRKRYKPKEVSAMIAALYWPGKYAVPGHPTSARILNLWLRCKVHKLNFDKAIERKGEMSRASAYRFRDRALTAIATGLHRDGVPL